MKPTLKQQNLPMKFIAYGILLWLFLWLGGLLPNNSSWVWENLDFKKLVTEGTVPFLALSFLTLLLGGLLPHIWKERFVHFRWSNPLPGCRAFSKHAAQDTRINLSDLETKFGTIPAEPAAQNAYFYKIYKTCRDNPAVVSGHKNYLLFRDLAFDTFILSWVSIVLSLLFEAGFVKACLVLAVGLAISGLFSLVANNYSHRFICNTLANAETE